MPWISTLTPVMQLGSGEGLTFQDIVASLPTDPVSLFVLAMVAGLVVLVLWTGRPRGKGGPPA
jgi:hypothetical protein